MQAIIYDVAVSIDGYISGPGGDISQFAQDGEVVEDYAARLGDYAVAIMGRETYEFGYQYGLEPGTNPYAQMQTMVFSQSIDLPKNAEVSTHQSSDAAQLLDLKRSAKGPIYLCGGGAFAGSLLAMNLIDCLRLKRAPVILGDGVRLFGNNKTVPKLAQSHSKRYDNGYTFEEYQIVT